LAAANSSGLNAAHGRCEAGTAVAIHQIVELAAAIAWTLPLLMAAVHIGLCRRERARESKARQQLAAADDVPPVSLHPEVDSSRCIGSGSCVRACPEHDVLGIVDGVARVVNPLACVGHGACAAACGMDAIRLVFGSPQRGVTLPKLSERFETTSRGVFVVGELAGMGLIRNALRQGVEAGTSIARGARAPSEGALDAIVVGAGPAGTGAALALLQARKRVVVLEREVYGGTIAHYPRGKVVMTGDLEFPGYGRVRRRRMSKEELIALWVDLRDKTQLPVMPGVLVSGISAEPDGMWRVTSSANSLRAAHVVLALGRRGAPRKLDVPGEELPKVSYRLLEPQEHQGRHVLVVGGGNSAIETALQLAAHGGCASVSISHRRKRFARARAENQDLLERAVAAGEVQAHLDTQLVAIDEREVTLRNQAGSLTALPNDAVIVQVGGTDPSVLLTSFGVELQTLYGEPG
jgi:thioredoxin reductase/NAD-dependent dihydropyrimidine dehydrogenase PreA subunit